MFEYFPENYVWSHATVSAVGLGGAAISEIEEACRPLKEASVRNDLRAQHEWFESWKRLAGRIEAIGREHERAGQTISAGNKLVRSSVYYFMAERMLPSTDARKVQTYKQGLAAFKKGMTLRKELMEWVEIPYKDTSLPALFSPVPGKQRSPCMVHFDGFDWLKEYSYLAAAQEFRRRGISLLVVDHPGVGEALRLRNLPSGPDTEVPAGACVDYLETRTDVDPKRIGIMALSLGGYYAPRAAAFEKRFSACVAWAGCYSRWEVNKGRIVAALSAARAAKEKDLEPSVPNWVDQFTWVAGKKTLEEAADFAKQYTLEGVLDKITCPLLVVHGENDRQTPVWHAERTIAEAVNSPAKKLKIFTLAEGGAEHCQVDNASMAVDYMADWVAETLGGNPKGV